MHALIGQLACLHQAMQISGYEVETCLYVHGVPHARFSGSH